MNNSIATYDDLVTEKKRLTLLLQDRKMELKAEYEDLKAKLKPLGTMAEFAQKITTKDRSNPLVSTGIEIGVNFLLRNLVFRKAGWAVKILAPLFVRNYLSHEANENGGWLDKVGRFIKKKIG